MSRHRISEWLRDLCSELRRRRVIRVAIAYIAAWFMLLQGADLLIEPMALPEWTMTALVVAMFVLFPVAMVLSWLFDIGPGGVVMTASAERIAPPAPPAPDEVFPRKRIAVLPFRNLSEDPENVYFSDGMTDELIAVLSGIRELSVVSRTSVMAMRDRPEHAIEIGRRLRVGSLVEGSVRRAGRRVRITARLVDASGDDPLWSSTYDRELEDIFAIQSDVARHIARSLEAELSRDEERRLTRAPTGSLDAYDLYLRGRFAWNRRTEAGLSDAITHLSGAVELDPEFGLAHAALADAYVLLGIYNARRPSEVMPVAEREASRSLELDPDSGEAEAALGTARAVYHWDWEGAARHFAQAIQRRPRYATAHQWMAMHVLAPQRRFDEADEFLETAAALDSQSAAIRSSVAFLRTLEGRFDESEKVCRALIERTPRFAMAHYFLGQVAVATGDTATARKAFERARELRGDQPEILAALGGALALGGDRDGAETLLRTLEHLAEERWVSPARLAQLRLALEDRGGALDLLETAAEWRAPDLIWLSSLPELAPVQDEPRVRAILDSMGLPSPSPSAAE